MTANTQKQGVPEVPAVPAVPVLHEKIKGINTGITLLSTQVTMLNDEVLSSASTQKDVEAFRAGIKAILDDKKHVQHSYWSNHPEAIVQGERDIAENARKAVSRTVGELKKQMSALIAVSDELNAQYGTTIEPAGKNPLGGISKPNITAGKKESLLTIPAFLAMNPRFEVLEDKIHYRVRYTRNNKEGDSVYIQQWMREL
jgi:hypothetical protein